MCKVIIFAGTTEGRELAKYLGRKKIATLVCTATEYGESLIERSQYVEVSAKRLTKEEMNLLFFDKNPEFVVDATHPYATVVSSYVKEVCEALNLSYLRLVREESVGYEQKPDMVYVNSVKEACNYLETTTGNIFVTTGSKEVEEYTKLSNYKERVYARVLSSKEAMNQVMELGFEGKNLICMQGPFSEELNFLMFKESSAKYLVTKEAGKNGGFLEKINAALRLSMTSIVIGRPKEESGYSYLEVINLLNKEFQIEKDKRKIHVVGIGIGTKKYMTLEAIEAIEQADIIFGAKRMLGAVNQYHKPMMQLYKKRDIHQFLKEHDMYQNIAVLVSGDVGFYSAAKEFQEYFKEDQVTYVAGLSSLAYFCARIGKSWEDVSTISNHGQKVNTVEYVRRNSKVFSLLGGKNNASTILQELLECGFHELSIWIGENLGYETEKITFGNPEQLLTKDYESLCVMYIENTNAKEDRDRIMDEAFIRGNVPMTKEEIRTVSIAKLELEKDSILYDIGAGTGSVSIQAAKRAYKGYVYAIEKNPEGILLMKENKRKFQVSNMEIVEGTAPDILNELPRPTHAFIGGSSGALKEIIQILLKKNDTIKIVINAITIETIAEAISVIKDVGITNYEMIQLQSARAKTAGNYHMMLGQNPVTIIVIG
ncbi:MAG: precorrin-6A reductase [Candidatus Galacturonibacter soehngenii]|nr:precorrin-6A reductase [Candidatus Galacturonibacter soehngenii]